LQGLHLAQLSFLEEKPKIWSNFTFASILVYDMPSHLDMKCGSTCGQCICIDLLLIWY